jgi:hypothetical protein
MKGYVLVKMFKLILVRGWMIIMNMNLGYQLSICCKAKENHRRPGSPDLPDAYPFPASSSALKFKINLK